MQRIKDNRPALGFGPLVGLLLLGGFAAGASHPPLGLWPLALFCFVPLIWAGWWLPLGQAMLAGLLWGTVQALAGFYWITPLLMAHADLCAGGASALAMLGALYQGLFPMLFACLCARSRPGTAMSLVALPLLWAGLEWLQGAIFLRLPWQPLGQALGGYTPLIQTAEWWGTTGLSALVVLFNVLAAIALSPAKAAAKSRLACLGAGAFIFSAMVLWGDARLADIDEQAAQAQSVPVMAVQADQSITEQRAKPHQSPEALAKLSRQGCPENHTPPQLIVWPESAAPYYLFTEPGDGLAAKYLALEKHCYLLLGAQGAISENGQLLRTNRAWLLGPQGDAIGYYDKAALAPFGEYSPFGSFWFLKLLAVDNGEFHAGNPGKVLNAGPYKIGPLICFEALVPNLARLETKQGARLLVNLSNEAWFVGGVSAQVLAHLRLRCVENRRACVRSSNMGQSAAVSPGGRIIMKCDQTLCAEMPLFSELTPYTRCGVVWGPSALGLALGLLIYAGIRRSVGGNTAAHPA